MSLVKGSKIASEEVSVLLKPITEETPVGVFNEEDESYLFIEEQMIKLGGLQSASIDWLGVEEKAKQLLTQKFKHIRLFGYLSQCWLRENTWQKHSQVCELLNGFSELYFESAYPKHGKSGLTVKRRSMASMVSNLKSAFDGLERSEQEKTFFESYANALEALKDSCQSVGLNDDAISTITLMHDKVMSYATTPEPAAYTPAASPNQQGGKSIGANYFLNTASGGNGGLKDERETKRTLLSVAELINQRDAYDPTGYLIRRYALWGWTTSSPHVVEGQRTELRAAPGEVVTFYEEALSSNAVSPELLEKIEKSVVSSVYWFKGSYYTYEVAKSLEMSEVAHAIQHATARFIRRLPILMELQFNDKQPFIDEVTAEWIKKAGTSDDSANVQPLFTEVDDKRLKKEMSALMESKGVEGMLLYLEKKQSQKQSMRKHAQSIKIAADLLAEKGFNWLAEELYKKVETQMLETLAVHWEPELYRHVATAKKE